MKTITLNASGIKFSTTFNTFVTKVINPDKDSKIVLDALPHIELSLGSETATSLGIEKDSEVTVKPVDNSDDGSFTLEIGEKIAPKKSEPQASRGGGCSHPLTLSNNF